MPKPVLEQEDVTLLWNHAVHTDREVTANRPDIIIKNKNGKICILIEVAIPCRQKCCAKGSGKEAQIQEFMYKNTTNEEPEMQDYTSNNWSYWNSNKGFKEKIESHTRKTFNIFTTKHSFTWNITHNTECIAVGITLASREVAEEKACDKRQKQQHYNETKKKTRLLRDLAVLADRNVTHEGARK